MNNWHWAEQDLAPWAKERLTELVVDKLVAKNVPDKGWVKVTKLDKCEGEASVSNRKGKRIVAYELKVTCKWQGSVDYDEAAEAAMFEQLEQAYDQAWLDAPGSGDPDPSPIFVLGQPRTGTTLIERIIGSHSQVHAAGEAMACHESFMGAKATFLKLVERRLWRNALQQQLLLS